MATLSIKSAAIAYLSTGIAFAVIDAIWLSTMTSRLYRPVMGDMLADEFRLAPAVAFYLIFIAALVFFAIRPALAAGDWKVALLHGAFFGFAAYATYDLTSQAVLRNWSTLLTVADLIWGTVLSASSAVIGYKATRLFTGV
ncbi:putative membrane protein [Rhizobium sp. SG_E_25_P2]|nr:putative membrane protein [Rhizobium sp. SG_E_25_P2]